MAEENDDLEKEGIEITASARLNPDLDDLGATPVTDSDGAIIADELDGDKLDLPDYVDDDKGLL